MQEFFPGEFDPSSLNSTRGVFLVAVDAQVLVFPTCLFINRYPKPAF